jgi:nitrogen regulatory protein PII
MSKEVELVIVVVNRGFSEVVMDSAREAGATGGTILNGRGSEHAQIYHDKFSFHPEKEVVLIVCKKIITKNIMQAINEKVGLATPGSGVCFALPVLDVVGINLFKDEEVEQNQDKSTL